MEKKHYNVFAPFSKDHIVQHSPATVVIKENNITLTGDSFKIYDANQRLMFEVNGKMISLSQRKELLDRQGRVLGSVRKKHFSLHDKQRIYNAADREVAVIGHKRLLQIQKNAVIEMLDGSGDIKVEGSILARHFEFKQSGRVLGSVRRKGLNARNLIMGKDTYMLTVNPGVDLAFMIAITVALDELFRDDN